MYFGGGEDDLEDTGVDDDEDMADDVAVAEAKIGWRHLERAGVACSCAGGRGE